MLLLIAVVAVVVVVGVFAYPNVKDTLIPSTPDIPVPDKDMAAEIEEVLRGIETEPVIRPEARPENLVPDSQGAVDEEPTTETDVETTEEEESSGQEEPTEELADNSTAANDAKEDGINDAYFAKEIFVEKGEEVAGTYNEYRFGNDKNYPENQGNKEGDADYILENTRSILNAKKEFTTKEAILNGITKDTYSEGDTISFITYKMIPEYEKIDSAPLSSEVFIVAKTTNLDEETVTITIQEKEELLVAKDAPLPVLEMPEEEQENARENQTHTRNEERMEGGTNETRDTETSENNETIDESSASTDSQQESETTSEESEEKDAEENEITEIKAVVEEGIAKKKIKLRPKSAEDLQTWTEKLKGGTEDGMHSYQVKNQFSVTGDADAIATNIQNNSNNTLTDHIVKKEDIIELLVEGSTYNNTTSFVFPKYKKGSQTEFLWLKAHAYGGEEEHNEEFLNQDDTTYFRIGDICECEAKVRAYMRMLRIGEGTGEIDKDGNPIDPQRGYTTRFGNVQFSDMSTHPGLRPGSGSSAAGAYQIMQYTWWEWNGFEVKKNSSGVYYKTGVYFENRDYAKKYGITGFDEMNQDLYCLALMKHHSGCATFIDDIINDKIEETTRNCGSRIWASLPHVGDNSRYRFRGELQPATPMEKVLEHYETFLKEELAGESYLHLEPGFLKEFGYGCCNDQPSGWHDPVDNPISTNYFQNGNAGIVAQQWGLFGDDVRREVNRKHSGLDLFATTGSNIYACVDGTIYNRRWHGGYGNTVTIKVKDPKAFLTLKRQYTHKSTREDESGSDWNENGDIYLFYAHLDSVNEFSFGEEVKSGQVLGKCGRSGIGGDGTHAPHLHFEIFSTYSKPSGTRYCYNPAYYVPYKHFSEQSEAEKIEQTTEKNRGYINEYVGAEKLQEKHLKDQ
ncbi:hypothetical protein D1815_02660 [Aquimarina sp. AD1]|uniref:peptidoglycan DD-metalloendopeptidase family protein n=1 Tax=Aquimarina sp. (strain AD1) TaxID=1714848 RepID=UPI000E4AD36C|nr:peptidoglycan DD-metalloendopeptidase family protein [Aquimarina sp. AD1]AXT54706.1 hypothetical protein D1815_02660 [Aquimarina sp. AD1]RKN23182.1 hypothetical protein D7035_11735 [Aquimarina sp. AD1]